MTEVAHRVRNIIRDYLAYHVNVRHAVESEKGAEFQPFTMELRRAVSEKYQKIFKVTDLEWRFAKNEVKWHTLQVVYEIQEGTWVQ